MGNHLWLERGKHSETDFVGGFDDEVFVTIELKSLKSGFMASWVASRFEFFFNKEINDFENSIKCYVPFILTETYEIDSQVKIDSTLKGKLDIFSKLYRDSKGILPRSILAKIQKEVLLQHWRHHRKRYLNLNSDLGIQRTTVFDYLLLQSLGLKDFASYISNEDKVKLLTVRDRLAYARRHGWLKKPGVGIRTSYMSEE